MIWFLILFSSFWTKVLRFRPIIFNRDVQTAISAPRWTTSGETSFFWNKLSVSYYSRIFRTKILDIQRKKNQDFQNCIERVRRQNRMKKMFFFGLVSISHNCADCDGNTFEFSAKTFPLGSPNCLVRVSTKNLNEVIFLWTFQFQFFSRF